MNWREKCCVAIVCILSASLYSDAEAVPSITYSYFWTEHSSGNWRYSFDCDVSDSVGISSVIAKDVKNPNIQFTLSPDGSTYYYATVGVSDPPQLDQLEIFAVNVNGESSSVRTHVLDHEIKLDRPTNIKIGGPSLTPTFSWDAVAGADKYRIRIYNASMIKIFDSSSTAPGHFTDTSYTIPNGTLSAGEYYTARIYAYDIEDENGVPTLENRSYSYLEFNNPLATKGVDFDSDGKPDILWRNKTTGENYLWYMRGTQKIGETELPSAVDTNWSIVGVGDFNGDGKKSDILWRNILTGQNYVWYMNDATKTGGEYLQTIDDMNWAITGVGDFDSNGTSDILWSNTATGQNRIWYMMGATKSSAEDLPSIADRTWVMVGVGDFNSDGMPDILWSHRSSGQNYVWYMDGAKRAGGDYLPTIANLNWEVVDVDDFNSDGKPDVLWRNKSTGENYLWYMNGATKTSGEYLESVPDTNWKIVNH